MAIKAAAMLLSLYALSGECEESGGTGRDGCEDPGEVCEDVGPGEMLIR